MDSYIKNEFLDCSTSFGNIQPHQFDWIDMSTGPVGYLHHWSSRKLVHPKGGSHDPGNDTNLVVNSTKDDPSRLQFRFVAVDGAGHFGYIEHVSSGKIVHPKGGSLDPGNDTNLVLHSNRHAGALFGFDEENIVIMHKGGKIWHPKGGKPDPGNDTPLVLNSDRHDAAKFFFGNLGGDCISPYPTPNLSGDWKLLQAFVTPLADHTYSVTYTVGKSVTKSQTTQNAWNVSVGAAKDLFSASAEYSGFVQKSSSTTWKEEMQQKYTINVKKGQSVWVWQYVFGISQYDDEIRFQSTIIGDTDSQDKKPVI